MLAMFRPVSAGAPLPCANSRFNVPDGLLVLFPTGSAWNRKTWLTALLVPLLNAEAVQPMGCEVLPAVAVAVPVAGRLSKPRIVPPPFTSSLAAGVVVPMPTFVPLSKICEFVISALASNLATVFTVPPAVVTGVVPVASGCAAALGVAVPAGVIGADSTKAVGGSPPMVAASPAFKA